MGAESDLSDVAVSVAAKATGLREDQIRRAVLEYRSATGAIDPECEPEWAALMHMHGKGFGIHQYVAHGTSVTLQVETGGKGPDIFVYVYKCKPYETFSEARAIELQETTMYHPHSVTPTTTRGE